jgi:hypothetical protein
LVSLKKTQDILTSPQSEPGRNATPGIPLNDSNPIVSRQWLIALVLFLLALWVRLPGLDEFVTADEVQWIDRSRWFTIGLLYPDQECPAVKIGREFPTHGLGCTLQTGYPGVTTMWAGMSGLLTHYWMNVKSPGTDLRTFLLGLSDDAAEAAVIAQARRPVAVLGALFVAFFYLLLRRLSNPSVALVAAILVNLQPFQIALTRVIHHDSLNATFMVLSALALIGYWLRHWHRYWLIVSAVLGGLALLSKQVSWCLLFWVALLAAFTFFHCLRQWTSIPFTKSDGEPTGFIGRKTSLRNAWGIFFRLSYDGLIWGGTATLTFCIMFPAMWVFPFAVLRTMFTVSTRLAEAGHPHFFFGEISRDPGWLFYPMGWLLRATPLEVLGLAGIIAAGICRVAQRGSAKNWFVNHSVEAALSFFVVLLFVFVNLSPKKVVRYFLPAFPVLDFLSTTGLIWLLAAIGKLFLNLRWLGKKPIDRLPQISSLLHRMAIYSIPILACIIFVIQGRQVINHYPYYLTYYSALFGGAPGAAELMTIMGWGEGLNEAAYFLNRQPDIKTSRIMAEGSCQMISPFLSGNESCLNTNSGGSMTADYVLYYYTISQRSLCEPAQRDYYSRHQQPIHRVTLHDLDYVRIYRNPIQNHVDREANSLPEVLTTLGFNLTPDGKITLFWQNLGLNPVHLNIGITPIGNRAWSNRMPPDPQQQWVECRVKPEFVADMKKPKAIIESLCPLSTAVLRPGLYQAKLATQNESGIMPLESSHLAVLKMDPDGRFGLEP